MRVFVAVVEEGGMSVAARRLHLSRPTLSQTISALERELGVELLVRSSTGVAATEASPASTQRPPTPRISSYASASGRISSASAAALSDSVHTGTRRSRKLDRFQARSGDGSGLLWIP